MNNFDPKQRRDCPCGSGRQFSNCCGPYALMLPQYGEAKESVLISWMDRYSIAIQNSFRQKAQNFLYRISIYADIIFDFLCPLGFRPFPENQDTMDVSVKAIKHNIMLSLISSLSCLSQGLFLQSGSLIRNCIEDSLVLLDINENELQLKKFLLGNYSANNVLKRVKQYIPAEFKGWYGHFSANFAHFGPFHAAPYTPRACYPDNYVLGSGLENILLATYMFHVVLERTHYNQLPSPSFWRNCKGWLEFSADNGITRYIHRLQDAILEEFPPEERKAGFSYFSKVYRAK